MTFSCIIVKARIFEANTNNKARTLEAKYKAKARTLKGKDMNYQGQVLFSRTTSLQIRVNGKHS